ncbi:MAG: hypothetical protein B7Z51_05865 [Methyloversatilis sp. 12-65-5]|nr:MAG: hypothetical protein B7Z51_05865 [Methyloversatilis sp. 12-65-5]
MATWKATVADATEVLRLNREAVAFFEGRFAHAFPFPKYDLVLIPELAYGGMEHAGATFLREEFSRGPLRKLMYLAARPVIQAFRNRVDHRRYNGATLLGLRGVVVKSHGSSDAYGFEEAVARAADAVRNDLIARITLCMTRTEVAA